MENGEKKPQLHSVLLLLQEQNGRFQEYEKLRGEEKKELVL